MKPFIAALSAAVVLSVGSGGPLRSAVVFSQELLPADLDRMLAPIALYPDQLLAQMLLSAMNPESLKSLDAFLKKNTKLKGTDLQDAALKNNFEPSFVALTLFPQVVQQMVAKIDVTTQVGAAFKTNRALVLESIQRLRTQAHNAGTLKTTPQQSVETQTTSGGQEVIIIEPANPQVVYVPQYNPQVVYVPQYNPQVVYTQPTTSTVVIKEESSSADAAVAGLIGFTAGIAIGAAIDNDYYYGPYGWRGGAYMYNDAWDDYYDHREDAREDWMDHREDIVEDRGERSGKAQEQRTERTEARSDAARQGNAAGTREGTAAARQGNTAAATTRSGSTYESRGYSQGQERTRPTTTQERSGTRSDAFSGYSSGKSERAASSRGKSSRSSSRGGGGRRR